MPAPRPRINSAAALARLYLDIALWRRGPQDVPAVGILLPLTIAAYVLLSVVLGESMASLRRNWIVVVMADSAFLALWYWALLAIARRRERYLQTATAVSAAPGIATLWLMQHIAQDNVLQVSVYLAVPAVTVWILVGIWILMATGHILRAALERSLALCLTLAFMQMLTEGLFLATLEPGH
jgi:hypothetical protein